MVVSSIPPNRGDQRPLAATLDRAAKSTPSPNPKAPPAPPSNIGSTATSRMELLKEKIESLVTHCFVLFQFGTVLSGLAVVAGILALSSNPVGWGIIAGIAGAFALSSLVKACYAFCAFRAAKEELKVTEGTPQSSPSTTGSDESMQTQKRRSNPGRTAPIKG